MKQISARPALLAAAVLALSCAECGGGSETAHTKFGRPTIPATAVGSAERKRGAAERAAIQKTSARSSSSHKQPAVQQARKLRLATHQPNARRKKLNRPSHEKSTRRQFAKLGLASFYSEDRETASGETFNKRGLNAAHPSLPFGTRLRVTNVGNGRSVTVRVNDRGPFVHGRIIDVTSAAAKALGMVDAGVVRVTLDVVR